MSDLLERRLSRVRERLGDDWTAQRARGVRDRLPARARRRARRRVALLASGSAALLAAVWSAMYLESPARSERPDIAAVDLPVTEVGAVAFAPREDAVRQTTTRLSDGTELSAAAGALIEVDPRRDRARVRLSRGHLRVTQPRSAGSPPIEIALDPGIRVTASHAIFAVDRRGAVALVVVERGEVLLQEGPRARSLSAGDTARIDLSQEPGDATDRAPVTAGGERPLARALAEADAARRAGRPEEAAGLLERALIGRTDGEEAAAVAFTLGRVRLADLHDPAAAADAFARARALAPGGELSEDALAREVLAADAAGLRKRARRLADEYLTSYPEGRWRDPIRALVGAGGAPSP
jgi:tetratricopeptide (TPR) repeat protein